MATQEELIGDWTSPPIGGGLPIERNDYINQVRANCRLELPNVKQEAGHDLIMVMVCGGPTSKLHLEDIKKKRQDDKYRIFCSNKTHDWLIENGVVPHYHFIIDPKKSMLGYVEKPHKDVQYFVGSCCVPGVFKALEGFNIKRLFVYSGIEDDSGMTDMRVIQALYNDKDFTALEGGTMAGLRAMCLANLLGYNKVEFYGFDSCFFNRDKEGNPIYYSYDKKRVENIMECKTTDGKIYETTPVFASQARQFIKWKHRLEWIDFTIHGESLTAHINRLDNESLKPKHDLLITDYYLKMNQELFKGELFGITGHENAGQIAILAGQLAKKGDMTLLDYGCGQRGLEKVFPPIAGLKFYNYDICIEELSKKPEPADLVVCTDVLEHVEPECLENVLDDLKRLTKKLCFVSICLTSASKFYADGQNAHLSLLDFDVWYAKLRKRFHVIESETKKVPGNHKKFVCVLQAKEPK